MKKTEYVIVQNNEQMEEMKKALDFQSFKLEDNTLPKDLAQDQVLILDYANKSVECLPAKRALEDPNKVITEYPNGEKVVKYV